MKDKKRANKRKENVSVDQLNKVSGGKKDSLRPRDLRNEIRSGAFK
ncbi:hypothetical protein SAMN02746073_0062 [Legionella jamestowniensis DSM 19215]|nr:hypothetical protein SAMN02746073_0062 [Legionella jamestowniensis DSM 19215]